MVATGFHIAIMFMMVCSIATVLSTPPVPFPASFHPSHQLRGHITTASLAAYGANGGPSIASTIASLSMPATLGSLPNSASSPLLLASDDAATPLPAVPAASNRPVLTIPPPSRSFTAASPGPAKPSFETTSVALGLGSNTCFNGLTKLQSSTSSAQQQRAPSRTERTAAAAAAASHHRFLVVAGKIASVGPFQRIRSDFVVRASRIHKRRGSGSGEGSAQRGGLSFYQWPSPSSGRGALGSERVPG